MSAFTVCLNDRDYKVAIKYKCLEQNCNREGGLGLDGFSLKLRSDILALLHILSLFSGMKPSIKFGKRISALTQNNNNNMLLYA